MQEKDEELNDSRTLENGEKIYLVKDVGRKWQILYYECNQNVSLNGCEENIFEFLEGLPRPWKDMEFDTVDAAIEFAQKEIKEGKVPRNTE